MKRGFLLGKFMPLHEGHIFMCDVAANLVDQLTVLVCSRDCEPIDGHLRFSWAQASMRPNVVVRHLHRDIPQEPREHPEFWRIWQETIAEFHPDPIDMVFGSDDYIPKLAETVGAEPFLVDADRVSVPVSASLIRQHPAKHWPYIPAIVRPYFQKRICILGSESTGKSTLSEHLAQHFSTISIPEYGRTYDAVHRQGSNWQATDFLAIAQGHTAIAREIAMRAGPICIEDTDPLQTMVWATYLLGGVTDDLRAFVAEHTRADHYLLLSPDVKWTDDGTRYSGDTETRAWFFSQLANLLTKFDLPHTVISGPDWAARTDQAIEVTSKLLTPA